MCLCEARCFVKIQFPELQCIVKDGKNEKYDGSMHVVNGYADELHENLYYSHLLELQRLD